MSSVLACRSRAILRHLRSLFHGLDWLLHFNIILPSMQFVFGAGKSIKFKTMSAMPLKNTISGNFQDRVKLSNLFMFRLAVSGKTFPTERCMQKIEEKGNAREYFFKFPSRRRPRRLNNGELLVLELYAFLDIKRGR